MSDSWSPSAQSRDVHDHNYSIRDAALRAWFAFTTAALIFNLGGGSGFAAAACFYGVNRNARRRSFCLAYLGWHFSSASFPFLHLLGYVEYAAFGLFGLFVDQ